MEEVRRLQTQLELLKIKAGISTLHDEFSLAHVQATNTDMEEEIYENQYRLARVHSLITRHLQLTPICPVAIHIHLPRDRDERYRILQDMTDVKLRRATEAVLDRLSVLDPLKPYKHEERSTTPDGLHHYNCFEVHQFRGLRSARQLFDALVYWRDNMEICVTDMIGQLAVRDDTGQDHPGIYNARLVTTGELGGVEELNLVGFSRFHESYGPRNGAPLGVLAIDSVDEDELYPYKPSERTRKIAHATHTITECRDPRTNELVVVLATSVAATQLPPEFPLPPAVFGKVVENMPRWLVVMNRFLRESARTM